MDVAAVLAEAFDRVRDGVHGALDGVAEEALTWRADPEANTMAWLAWHLTRVQDDHVADVAGTAQAWTEEGWHERFGLPFDPGATGYGQDSDDVAAVRVTDPGLLTGYYDAVHERTLAFVRGLKDADLDR
ncbi:MAG TPA: DinB family protein, partial [Acidimicrobiales bacterium]|nr:DinB family protein [Acidimicrobiales bacterium]